MPFCMHDMKCLFHISNISTIATQGRVVEEDLLLGSLRGEETEKALICKVGPWTSGVCK